MTEEVALAHGLTNLESTESALIVLAKDEPNMYQDVMKSPDSQKWLQACCLKYDTIMGYSSWELVKRPPEVNIIRCRWTFRVKWDNLGQIDKYKARLVTQGFSQVTGLDFSKTYSPTIRFTSI